MTQYPPPPPAGNPPPYGYSTPPSNYLVWSILSTIFCCIPVGIVSIVFSTKVNGRWAAGDAAGAQDASRKAKLWAIIAAVCGIVGTLGYALVVILAASNNN